MSRTTAVVFIACALALAGASCGGGNGSSSNDVDDLAGDSGDGTLLDAGDSSVPDVADDADVADDTSSDSSGDDTEVTIPMPVSQGAVVVTELYGKPSVMVGAGEWFEIYNNLQTPVRMNGCFIKDEGGESVEVSSDADLVLQPGQFAVFASEMTAYEFLLADIFYTYTDFVMEDTGDEVIIECSGVEIDKVDFGPGDMNTGIALQLSPDSYDYLANDSADAWCPAPQGFGLADDLGSPGADNPQCVVVDPCLPNPCVSPPVDACDAGGTAVLSFPETGECTAVGEGFNCDYPPEITECSLTGLVCVDAECVEWSDPCDPNPCEEAPAPYCMPDGVTAAHPISPGECEVVNNQPNCNFLIDEFDCSTIGKECKAATCVDPVVAAKPNNIGDVLITEFMANAGPAPDYGEWIELYNTRDEAVNIKDCTLNDLNGESFTFAESVVIEPQGYIVVARSDDTTKTYGLVPDSVYIGLLLDNNSETIMFRCGLKEIDKVAYQSQAAVEGVARQLDPDAFDWLENDSPANWCAAVDEYGDAAKKGTPGEPNPACGPPPKTVAWCRLHSPEYVQAVPGDNVAVFGRVQIDGLTDLTPYVDTDGMARGQAGWGPAGSEPAANPQWYWYNAYSSPSWDGQAAGEPTHDEYVAGFTAPQNGTYSLAFRFSANGGVDWTYCDLNAGPGSDGSEDGYSVEYSGQMVTKTIIDPCDPNPCDDPPPDSCGGKWRLYYEPLGECTPGDPPSCYYELLYVDCTVTGQQCSNGKCVTP